jgi:glycosidase
MPFRNLAGCLQTARADPPFGDSMMIPTATYRIQFRNGMTFDRASELVPYLKRLGISHLYASPIFTATTGSTHGYDVTDANEIDPTIGGREGFEGMVKALKAEGPGLILDIVRTTWRHRSKIPGGAMSSKTARRSGPKT